MPRTGYASLTPGMSGLSGPGTAPSAVVPHWYDGLSVGNLPSTADWQELSGLATPTRAANSSYLWAQSDGSINKLLAINAATAATAGEWTLTGVIGVDHEDLASATVGGTPYVYLADFGDNGNARATFVIYRIVEPTITGMNGTVDAGDIHAIACEYPAGNLPTHKDAECLLVDPSDGKLYVITKRETVPTVYSLAHQSSYMGTQTLTHEGDMFDIPDIASVAATGNVVGGCMSPDGSEILIKNYNDVYYFPRAAGQTVFAALQQTGVLVPAYVGGGSTTYRKSHPNQEPQGEAICYGYSGSDFYTASEFVATEGSTAGQYPLFRYQRAPGVPTTIQFQDGVAPTAMYAGTLDTYIWGTNPDTVRGTEVTFVVDATPGNATDDRNGLVKFDLSTIPSSATVVGAELTLNIQTEGQGWVLYKMLVTWNESSTHNTLTAGVTIGTDCSATIDCQNGVTLDTLTGPIRNNVLVATVQSWVTNSANNFGWYCRPLDLAGGDGVQFHSRQATTASNRPRLTVRYI